MGNRNIFYDTDKVVFSLAEYARIMGFHLYTIRALARANKIPGMIKIGKRNFVPRVAIEKHLNGGYGNE